MPQSLAQVYLHLVWSTKNRIPFLKDAGIRDEMHAYLAGACKRMESPPLKVGGVEDHVHVACRLSRKLAIADLVKDLKKESSKWIKQRDPELGDFYWQEGYGAFSVSPAHVEALQKYIAGQAEHHQQEDFKTEFRRLLEKRTQGGASLALGFVMEPRWGSRHVDDPLASATKMSTTCRRFDGCCERGMAEDLRVGRLQCVRRVGKSRS